MNKPNEIPPTLFAPRQAPPDVAFRLADEADSMAIYASFYRQIPQHQFRTHFQRALQRQKLHRWFWLLAESQSELLGSGHLILYPSGAELANLHVLIDHRGKGIGAAMITVLASIAKHLAFESVEIGVAVDNTQALRLYQRLGFVEDRRVQIAQFEPSIILRKAL